MDAQEVNKRRVREAKDIKENKGMGMVSYVIFFIPLLAAKESKFAMYHANQGLLLLLTAMAVNTLGSVIPILGWLVILPIGNLLVFVLFVLGIVQAAKGQLRPLPVIGKFTIIKTPDLNEDVP